MCVSIEPYWCMYVEYVYSDNNDDSDDDKYNNTDGNGDGTYDIYINDNCHNSSTNNCTTQ